MNEVLTWCLENWKILAYILCTLVIFLCTVCPKKTKVLDTVKETILEILPELISKVEEPGNGKKKLHAVVEMCVAAVEKLYPGVNANQYITFIRQSVEAIGKTPQFSNTKKGQVMRMRGKRMSKRANKRNFSRAAAKVNSINVPGRNFMRGGSRF